MHTDQGSKVRETNSPEETPNEEKYSEKLYM